MCSKKCLHSGREIDSGERRSYNTLTGESEDLPFMNSGFSSDEVGEVAPERMEEFDETLPHTRSDQSVDSCHGWSRELRRVVVRAMVTALVTAAAATATATADTRVVRAVVDILKGATNAGCRRERHLEFRIGSVRCRRVGGLGHEDIYYTHEESVCAKPRRSTLAVCTRSPRKAYVD